MSDKQTKAKATATESESVKAAGAASASATNATGGSADTSATDAAKSKGANGSGGEPLTGAAAQAAAAPPPSYSEIEQLVIDFHREPDKFKNLKDPLQPLPKGIGELLTTVAEKVTNLAQKSEDPAARTVIFLEDALVRATVHFIAKSLFVSGADHYRILGLRANASFDHVHQHYRSIRRILQAAESTDEGQAAVRKVSESYVILRDPERRKDYDKRLGGRGASVFVDDRTAAASTHFRPEPRRSSAKEPNVFGGSSKMARVAGIVLFVLVIGGLYSWYQQPHPMKPEEHASDAPIDQAKKPEEPAAPATDVAKAEKRGEPLKGIATPEDLSPGSDAQHAKTDGEQKDHVLLKEVEDFIARTPPVGGAGGSSSANTIAAVAPSVPTEPAAAQSQTPSTQKPVEGSGIAVIPVAPTPPKSSQPVTAPTPPNAAVPPTAPSETAEGVNTATIVEGPAAATPMPQVDAEISRLLAQAEQQVAEGYLTQPPGNNAFETYNRILQIDGNSEQGRQGIRSIADRYVGMARYRYQRDRYDEALDMVDKGLVIDPEHEQLKVLKALVQEKMAKQQAAVVVPPPSSEPTGTAVVAAAVAAASPNGSPTSVAPNAGAGSGIAATPAPSAASSHDLAGSSQTEGTEQGDGGGLALVPAGVPSDAANAPEVGISAPTQVPPVASLSPPSATPTAITETKLNDLIDRFSGSYERGDLEGFLTMFVDEARTNNRISKQGIREDYQALFETTTSRLMRVKDVKWNFDKDTAIGVGDFSLTILKNGETRPRTYGGSLTFQVLRQGDKLLIKGLFHSQRKL